MLPHLAFLPFLSLLHFVVESATSFANVTLFDAYGQILAEGNRSGNRSKVLVTSKHIIFPMMPGMDAVYYAKISGISKFAIDEIITVSSTNLNEIVQHDDVSAQITLANLVGLLIMAMFCALFGVALRDIDYAYLFVWLCYDALCKSIYGGIGYTLNDEWRISTYTSAPLIAIANSACLLIWVRLGKFSRHSPFLGQLSWILAALFVLIGFAFYLVPNVTEIASSWLLLIFSYLIIYVGAWRGWMRGEKLCLTLIVGSLPSTIYFVTKLLESGLEAGGGPQMNQARTALTLATDMLLPCLLCAAMAVRSRKLKDETVRIANYDLLTGLPNRHHLLNLGVKQLSKSGSAVILIVNIDRFKAIAETLGAKIVDNLLINTGMRLATIEHIQVGRFQESSFCILLANRIHLTNVRNRIENDFSVPMEIDGQTVDINLTIGIDSIENSENKTIKKQDISQKIIKLIRNAEIALDVAQARKKSWLTYNVELETGRQADLGLLSDLERAMKNDELRMFLQPKVSLRDGSVNSAEALIRWQHPKRGLVFPNEFIPFVEQTGRIGKLTRWMLNAATKETAVWRAEGTPIQISVNISSYDLDEENFPDYLAIVLEKNKANPLDIRLEITESVAMKNPAMSLKVMAALQEMGISLSIDDFGTGHSSLAYLQKMPISELKVDRAFVNGICDGNGNVTLLKSIIELGHQLNLSVVAEGAETASEWALLADLDCDFAQGWFAAKPMLTHVFKQWFAENTRFPMPIS